jgi:hypothetical protein
MAKLHFSREKMPEYNGEDIEIFPDGDKTQKRIGVLKFNKGMSNLVLDEGQLPYKSMNEGRK